MVITRKHDERGRAHGSTTKSTTTTTMEHSTSPASSSSSGARKMSGALPVKGVHLGGVWAQWDKKLADGRQQVETMERELGACKDERDETAATLARTASTLANTEAALAVERSQCEEMARQLSAEKVLRVEEAEAIRRERASFTQQMTAMREELERAKLDAHNSGEKEEAANAMCEAAVADRDAHEDERVSLLERVRSDARAMEAQRLEIGRLQAEVRTLEKQRNQHCAHSEILLKEKNRLAGELLRIKRPLNYGTLSHHTPVSHLQSSTEAEAGVAASLVAHASSSSHKPKAPCASSPESSGVLTAASPFTPSPTGGGAQLRSKMAARRPASAGVSMHDSPASVHDSPASMLKTICFTPRGTGAGSASPGAIKVSAMMSGAIVMSPSDASPAAAAYVPPTKETIAERKSALMVATKAALARAGRKPLLSAANRSAVTAGPPVAVNENPWVQ